MECGYCGSYRHNSSSCPGIEPDAERNEEVNTCVQNVDMHGGDNTYALECCTTRGESRKSPTMLREHQESIGELWDCDSKCWHVLDPNMFSGIRCVKCGGWKCY